MSLIHTGIDFTFSVGRGMVTCHSYTQVLILHSRWVGGWSHVTHILTQVLILHSRWVGGWSHVTHILTY